MEGFAIYRGTTQLADGLPAGAIVTDGPTINGQHVLDIEPFIFADAPVIYDRFADTDTVMFVIAREHDSKSNSLDHALRHGRTVRGVADLRIQFTEGGTTRAWLSRGAGWEATEAPAPQGYATAMRYKVICPGFEAPEIVAGGGDGSSPDTADLVGDLDGGDDDRGDVVTDDWNCQCEDDDDGAVVATFDAGEDT